MNSETYDALVIGAGFAGLTAARDLAKDGKRVLIVEARDRIGGRAWYRPFADTEFSIELGGNWVDPEGNAALMAEVERYGVRLSESPHPEHHVSLLDGVLSHAACPITGDDELALKQVVQEVLVQVRRIDSALLSRRHPLVGPEPTVTEPISRSSRSETGCG